MEVKFKLSDNKGVAVVDPRYIVCIEDDINDSNHCSIHMLDRQIFDLEENKDYVLDIAQKFANEEVDNAALEYYELYGSFPKFTAFAEYTKDSVVKPIIL